MDNTVKDLRYGIKLENFVKDKKINFLFSELLLFFFEQKQILFLEKHFFKTPRNLITSFFCLSKVNVIFLNFPVMTNCELNFNNFRSMIPLRLLK